MSPLSSFLSISLSPPKLSHLSLILFFVASIISCSLSSIVVAGFCLQVTIIFLLFLLFFSLVTLYLFTLFTIKVEVVEEEKGRHMYGQKLQWFLYCAGLLGLVQRQLLVYLQETLIQWCSGNCIRTVVKRSSSSSLIKS